MKNIKIHKDNDYSGYDKRPEMITKVELHFLDGTTQVMKMIIPKFTNWSDPYELTNTYLKGLIFHWCKYWLKIKSFRVSIGNIDQETGVEQYCINYPVTEIPLGKIYDYQIPTGNWIDAEEAEKKDSEKRKKQLTRFMEKGKHLVSGQYIESKPIDSVTYLN